MSDITIQPEDTPPWIREHRKPSKAELDDWLCKGWSVEPEALELPRPKLKDELPRSEPECDPPAVVPKPESSSQQSHEPLEDGPVSDLLKILDRAEAGVPANANSNNDELGRSKPRLDLIEAVIREEPLCPYPPVDWNAIAQRSARSGEKFVQRAIYPEDSILASYMDASRQICEGASCWSLGAILPVVAAMLKRRVFYPRGDKRVYLNLFNFLVGRPGHRKTTALKLAEQVAYVCLPAAAFLPERCSVEALFDEYCQEAGGRPDKLWMVEEANVVMTTWAKSAYGECVAAEMLRLHDCCKLQEAFKRNKKEKTSSKGRRVIPETSTSAVFAGTFSAAAVPVARVKEGLSRRFRFYVGEAQERTIIWPDSSLLKEIIESFEPLLHLSGPIGFLDDKATMAFWEDYQRKNRKLLDEVGLDDDTLGARLSTAPDNLLKVAGLFEACRSVAAHRASFSRVPLECFELAAVHVEENLRAGAFLDKYSKRKTVQERAEVVLAVIRKDFPVQHPDTSYLSRTELTRKFCLHTGRLGALTPEDLYLYIIPELVGQGEAVLACKRGKLEVYAFRRDDKAEGDDTSSG